MHAMRIEVYLDAATTPLAVLEAPPYRLELDTRDLNPGPHTLRVVTHHPDGTREERLEAFELNAQGALKLEAPGLALTAGRLTLDLTPPESPRSGGLPPALAALAVLLLLAVVGGVWGLHAFADTPAPRAVVATLEPEPGPDGAALYQTHCAACHQAAGEGVPGVFPALAQNPRLNDTNYLLETLLQGRGGMPQFAHLTDAELAALATFVRTHWGNAYGPIPPETVAAHR